MSGLQITVFFCNGMCISCSIECHREFGSVKNSPFFMRDQGPSVDPLLLELLETIATIWRCAQIQCLNLIFIVSKLAAFLNTSY